RLLVAERPVLEQIADGLQPEPLQLLLHRRADAGQDVDRTLELLRPREGAQARPACRRTILAECGLQMGCRNYCQTPNEYRTSAGRCSACRAAVRAEPHDCVEPSAGSRKQFNLAAVGFDEGADDRKTEAGTLAPAPAPEAVECTAAL